RRNGLKDGSNARTIGRLDNLKRNILKRYSDLDYDSFVGLMGRRSAGKLNHFSLFLTGEMHDIFVGLMGRRNSEPGKCSFSTNIHKTYLCELSVHVYFDGTLPMVLIFCTIYLYESAW
uniref:Uncharacterized protein n=1 Tax=Periophthalmus magnuspinnatus TaxID=409849 RepID=A0A3B3ZZF9_9GOBI